ncbi:hypothetical protein AWC35_02945 [Gibbsiella quercinecans]|uniref:Uncharacterized protein n=1 Tax=Gibbsiella quercinecans TaxID=929813 RepID=A0A250AWP9_9GAMM|nr:hypothetical protein AWC35_02945 [Gibbsiella quercinecans]
MHVNFSCSKNIFFRRYRFTEKLRPHPIDYFLSLFINDGIFADFLNINPRQMNCYSLYHLVFTMKFVWWSSWLLLARLMLHNRCVMGGFLNKK